MTPLMCGPEESCTSLPKASWTFEDIRELREAEAPVER